MLALHVDETADDTHSAQVYSRRLNTLLRGQRRSGRGARLSSPTAHQRYQRRARPDVRYWQHTRGLPWVCLLDRYTVLDRAADYVQTFDAIELRLRTLFSRLSKFVHLIIVLQHLKRGVWAER